MLTLSIAPFNAFEKAFLHVLLVLFADFPIIFYCRIRIYTCAESGFTPIEINQIQFNFGDECSAFSILVFTGLIS